MAIAKHMNLIVAPDSAMTHVAGGLGVPIVGIYGPFSSRLRMRYYFDAIGINAKTACSPCFTHGHEGCVKGNPSPCFSTIDVPTILVAIDYLFGKTNQPRLTDMETMYHTEFNKVMPMCKKYMEHIGVDYGTGYMQYPKEIQIARVDANPMCDADICADYTTLEIKENINFLVSSFAVNTIDQLKKLAEIANNLLIPEGYLILYVGDKNMVSKIETRFGRLNILREFFISELTPDEVVQTISCCGFELVLSLSEYDKWQKDLYDIEKPEDLNYGFLSIWQKQADTSK
jgi:hypothetical protein